VAQENWSFYTTIVNVILSVLGFLSIADISSPPVVSRHLVLSCTTRDDSDEESRAASLCVFIHGALKVENMCAVVQVQK
jgi:Integrator complex subunit 14